MEGRMTEVGGLVIAIIIALFLVGFARWLVNP
jgi:hypothetical protein